MQSCSRSLPAPPRGLCSHGNQTLPAIGRALSAGEGSSGPPPTPGQFTTQSSNRATLGRDKQAGRGWHGRSHGVAGSGKSTLLGASRQPSAFKSSCCKGHMEEGSATGSAKRHMGDGSATVSSQLAGGRHSTASEEVSTRGSFKTSLEMKCSQPRGGSKQKIKGGRSHGQKTGKKDESVLRRKLV